MPSADVHQQPELLVVGAGLAGLAVAAEARRRGLEQVLIIDALGVATQASGRNAGALVPDAHALTMPASFASLARRGLQLHRQLHARLSLTLRTVDWIVPVDDLPLDPTGTVGADGRIRLLDRPALEARLGTSTKLPRAAVVPDQAVTDPVGVAVALAREAGGVAVGIEAVSVTVDGDRVAGVETTAGTIRPGALVVATGRGPGSLLPDQRWVKGHLAATEPAPFDLGGGGVALGGTIVVIQQPDGRLLVGGTREEGVQDGSVQEEVLVHVRRELIRLLPEAAGLRFEKTWTGQRPAGHDDLPTVDRLAGTANGYVIAGLYHSGLCTAPAIAEAIVTAVESGELPDGVRPFAARG